jgi:hypothetical protein
LAGNLDVISHGQYSAQAQKGFGLYPY